MPASANPSYESAARTDSFAPDAATAQLELASLRRQLAEERARRRQLERLVEVDPLTGLLNRRGLARGFASAAADRARWSTPFGLAFIDLDGFKQVNDLLGHQAGDRVLVRVSEALLGIFRANDSVARIGGDEFAVLLRGVELSGIAARLFHERIAMALGKELSARNLPAVSVGIVWARPDESLESLLARADRVMYDEKRRSRRQ